VLKALDPLFAQVDERSAADLILFAREYSQYLNYYSLANEPDGRWSPLMRMDLSVVLATLGNQRTDHYLRFIRSELAWLADRSHANEGELKKRFTGLFNFTYSWLYELEFQSQLLPPAWPFKTTLADAIRSVMAALRYKLERYYVKAKSEHLVAQGVSQPGIPLPFSVQPIEQLQFQYWQEEWAYTPDPDQPFDPQFYGTTVVSKIKNMAVHNLFTGVFETVFKQATLIAKQAAESLEKSFSDFPRHTPHYALFLAFIRLFRFAQEDLNGFTKRHLDLYYRDILRLLPKPPVPDQVHLIVELQKNSVQHLIKKETLFKAGKDAAGNEVFYAAEKDVVINKASVAAIRSLRTKTTAATGGDYQLVLAAPVTNSADGKGEPIKGEDKSWSPFGPQTSQNLATFGFAIASHLLFLQEGNRLVTLDIEATQNLPANDYLFAITPTVQLTGEKGWEEATVMAFGKNYNNPKRFWLQCLLSPKATAIVPFNPAVHQEVYDTPFPLMRVLFASTEKADNRLKEWTRITLAKIDLQVDVNGLKKLVAINELSVLDTAKPFQPFGPSPGAGSAFLIGSNEIFQKENASVRLHFTWDKVPQPEGIMSRMSFYRSNLPSTADILSLTHDTVGFDYDTCVLKASVSHLQNGSWGIQQALQKLFTSREMFGNEFVDHYPNCSRKTDLRNRGVFTSYPESSFTASPATSVTFTVQEAIAPNFAPTTPFSNDTIGGFVKLELNRDTGQKNFVQRFTQLAAKQLAPPLDPYIPQAKSLTVEYTAKLTLDFAASAAKPLGQRKWQFFSVHPFGVKEENHSLNNQPSFTLTPLFAYEGEFLIGLANAMVNTSVSILFQVSEGSANPLRTKQDVVWQYLANGNVWKDFAKGKVSDDTNGLLHSGIIAFALPSDLADAPTLMGGSLRWLRAYVVQNGDAVCNLLELRAQAIKAVWTNTHNPSLRYSQITPSGTISKLQHADAAVKKIEQPFESFGGRLAEGDERFYLRSSERLRHKRRAITIWDYEHLVLDAFPEIYKVKCLNHTKVRMDATGNEKSDNELAPGCVVVVPLPDLRQIHSRNPLRPLTSMDTLVNIENYLKKITSGFVRLQCRNAVFEEVVIHGDVKFFGNDPAFYHDVLLDDLQKFLCPWAYDSSREVEFGGKISKSVLINFIEERPYVDYLTRFGLFLRKDGVTIPKDQEEIETTTARSILVIAPKTLHQINYENVQC
jgi:hypothetical protein